MKYFDLEEVLLLHFKIIKDFGGSQGIRDEGRLKSVVTAPKQEAFGDELYSSVFEKAAVYLRNIIADHPFVDGNKRTAVTLSVLFLKRHGIEVKAIPLELADFAVQVAVEHLEIPTIASWLKSHSSKD